MEKRKHRRKISKVFDILRLHLRHFYSISNFRYACVGVCVVDVKQAPMREQSRDMRISGPSIIRLSQQPRPGVIYLFFVLSERDERPWRRGC